MEQLGFVADFRLGDMNHVHDKEWKQSKGEVAKFKEIEFADLKQSHIFEQEACKEVERVVNESLELRDSVRRSKIQIGCGSTMPQ